MRNTQSFKLVIAIIKGCVAPILFVVFLGLIDNLTHPGSKNSGFGVFLFSCVPLSMAVLILSYYFIKNAMISSRPTDL